MRRFVADVTTCVCSKSVLEKMPHYDRSVRHFREYESLASSVESEAKTAATDVSVTSEKTLVRQNRSEFSQCTVRVCVCVCVGTYLGPV